jgi:hypothetical protein
VTVCPGGAVARGSAPQPSVLVSVGAGVSTRAEISGVVINADGTVRETFGGASGTWTGRFRVRITATTVVGWVATGTVSGTVRWLLYHYFH